MVTSAVESEQDTDKGKDSIWGVGVPTAVQVGLGRGLVKYRW